MMLLSSSVNIYVIFSLLLCPDDLTLWSEVVSELVTCDDTLQSGDPAKQVTAIIGETQRNHFKVWNDELPCNSYKKT